MAIQIGAKPQHDFHTPLGLLGDCHRRIEKFLDQLLTLAEQAHGGELTETQRETLDTALRYFQGAAPLHTQDEEDSLFPRMRASENTQAQKALAVLDALEADHRAADLAHAEIKQLGQRWLANGTLSSEEALQLPRLLHDLRETYRRHIAVEDEEIFPLAANVLSEADIRLLGREMAERRGLNPDNLPSISSCQYRKRMQG